MITWRQRSILATLQVAGDFPIRPELFDGRVLPNLIRKGFVTPNMKITDAGREALEEYERLDPAEQLALADRW